MKKYLSILFALVLVLSLSLVTAVPAGASTTTITLVSSTATQTAGYTTSNPSADPLNPSLYSVPGWTSAVAVSSVPGVWASLAGATWVSTTPSYSGNDGNYLPDSWRLFKAEFTIPTGAIVTSASIELTADNAFELYFNGTSIASTFPPDTVFGSAPGPPYSFPRVPPYPFQQLYGPYTFTPVVGTNTLMFAVRNWDNTGAPNNPTGLLYKAVIEYALPEIEKELLEGPEEIGIYLPEATKYIFEIAYSNPDPTTPVRIIDTVPAEFEILSVVPSDGTAIFFDTSRGRGNSANRIEWDLPAGTSSATLTVEIQTVESPGKGHRATVFKPTSCGPLPLNDGAIAYEVDEDGNLVLVEVVDPDTGAVTLVPVVIVGPSNALEVQAIAGTKPCEEG